MTERPRQINGLWNMGRPRTPPLPAAIQMKDRSTGDWYQLSHAGTPGSLTLDVTTTLWRKPDVSRFLEFEGPYLSRGNRSTVRLYVENGVLKGELDFGPVISSPRAMTRKSWQRVLLEITVGPSWMPGDAFTLTEKNLASTNS